MRMISFMSLLSFMDGSGDTFRNDSLATSLPRSQKASPERPLPFVKGIQTRLPPGTDRSDGG